MARREPVAALIRACLEDDPDLPLDQVEVTEADGEVVLTGKVEWRYESERIEYLVEQVEGVRVVRNEIAVTPVVEANEAIAAAIAAAANAADGGGGADIRIEANGEGTLTLLGRVQCAAASRAALAVAWALPGVQNVKDELAVDR